jgi:hypothetical protein
LDRFWDHSLEQDFDCHCVRTTVMSHKELAIAGIGPIVKGNVVIVVITMKSQVKFVEKETISFLSITLCLLSFANQSVVHCFCLLSGWKIKKARK